MSTKLATVLVVDDDAIWRDTLTDVLVSEGYAVTTAENGREALELFSELDRSIVVTDLQMPIMDGRHLLEALHERARHLPVIVVTGAEVNATSGLTDAFRVLKKPISPDVLLATVAAAETSLARRARRRHSVTTALRNPVVTILIATTLAASAIALVLRSRLSLGNPA